MSTRRMTALDLPGLLDTYTYVQADSTLSLEGEAADAKVTGDALLALATESAAGIAKAERQVETVVTERTNLYNKTTRKVDTGVSGTTGAEVSKTGWDVSDYIPVRAGVAYMAKVRNAGAWATGPLTNSSDTLYALYDADKAFVSSDKAGALTHDDGLTIPSGAAFIRIMCRKNTIATAPETLVVAEVSLFPADFIAYGSYTHEVFGNLTHSVTGETPEITAEGGHRYICGTVSTLSFTPSASGICSVRFTSGSTPTELTVPNSVKWPSWFNPASLSASTVYELCISDGVYGVVGAWT